MSEVEFHVGKAKEILQEFPTFEEKVQELSRQTGISVENLTEDWGDDYQTMAYRGDYVWIRKTGKMYQLLNDRNIEEDCDLIEAKHGDDGLIEYRLRWYNGGASFDEVFQEAIEKLENEN